MLDALWHFTIMIHEYLHPEFRTISTIQISGTRKNASFIKKSGKKQLIILANWTWHIPYWLHRTWGSRRDNRYVLLLRQVLYIPCATCHPRAAPSNYPWWQSKVNDQTAWTTFNIFALNKTSIWTELPSTLGVEFTRYIFPFSAKKGFSIYVVHIHSLGIPTTVATKRCKCLEQER